VAAATRCLCPIAQSEPESKCHRIDEGMPTPSSSRLGTR
jgi:hypothetical protein